MSDEARNKVDAILAAAGIIYSVVLKGATKRDGWECDAWSIGFQKGDGRELLEEFDYFTGTGHRSKPPIYTMQALRKTHGRFAENSAEWKAACKPQRPPAADVLHSLILDGSASEQSFASWCSDYGYDTDSSKAFATYEACQQSADKLRKIFNGQELDALREALQDY